MSSKQPRNIKIGLEIHVPLPTKTKLFCECVNDKNAPPNTHVCPICVGFPGAKPLLNEVALKEAVKIAMSLECKVETETFFARKTYFYPDLPKNYQITQHESAIGRNGKITLLSTGKVIRIHRVHLEEDPASMRHLKDGRTLIDHNRSGSPLVEVVTEPDFVNVDEVVEFLDLFFGTLRYLGHSNPERVVRCDLNVSLRGGARVEIKNVSGIKTARKGLMFEIKKQQKLIKAGKKIKRVTLAFDSSRGITIPLRSKEYEEDYGYIFEPDLTKYPLTRIVSLLELPRLPSRIIPDFTARFKITESVEKSLITDLVLAGPFWASLLERTVETHGHHVRVLNFLISLSKKHSDLVAREIQEKHWSSFQKIVQHVIDGRLSMSVLEDAVLQLIETGKVPQFALTDQNVNQEQLAEQLVMEYFASHPDHLEKAQKNPKFVNHIVGQIIRQSGKRELAKLIRKVIVEHASK